MFSKLKIYTLVLILLSATFNFSYADELSEVKTDINNMRVASEQSGILGGIFTKVFGTEGQIKNTFLSFITTTTNGYIPMWENSKLINSPISSNGGNVGIGVSNPNEKLDIAGGLRIRGEDRTIGLSNIANAWLKVGNSLGMDNNEIFFSGLVGHFGTLGNNDLRIYTDGTARMTLKGTGNIGINTPNPTEKLDVVGNIKASGNLTIGGSLNGDSILNNTIDSTEVEDNSLTADDLGTNSVGNDELIDNPTFSQITLNSTPTLANEVATKEYVDNISIDDLTDAKTTADSIYLGIVPINTTGIRNTAIGKASLSNNTTGGSNTAMGYNSLSNNIIGTSNTAMGNSSLSNNTIGDSNIAVGNYSLFSNSGDGNIAVGNSSLFNNSGNGNLAIGQNSMYNNSGIFNTAIGYNALRSNTTGGINIAIGYSSMHSNTTGAFNTSVGYDSLKNNTTGNSNIAIGRESLYDNTEGERNIAIGRLALGQNTEGDFNISMGRTSLYNNTTGNHNTVIGTYSLYNNTIGNYNTAIGNNSLGINETGSNNVALGYGAGYYETGSNKLYIDNSDTATPLIYGDFATNKLTINGSLKVGVATDLTCDILNEGSIRFDSLDKNFYGCNGTIWEQLNN